MENKVDANVDTLFKVSEADEPEYKFGTDFEFYPDSYFDIKTELEDVDFLSNTIIETKDDDLVRPVLSLPERASKQKQNGGHRKRAFSISSEDEGFSSSSPRNMLHGSLSSVRESGGKRKPPVSSKRTPSNNNSEEDDDTYYGQPNLTKNAIAARQNRLRKKLYIERMEESVSTLTSRNVQLESKLGAVEEENEQLRDEVQYLKNVLANSDDLAVLIDSIKAVNNIKRQAMYSSLKLHDYSKPSPPQEEAKTGTRNSGKRKLEETSENQENGKKIKLSEDSRQALGGVCLHVINGKLSLECCALCSVSAYNKNPN